MGPRLTCSRSREKTTGQDTAHKGKCHKVLGIHGASNTCQIPERRCQTGKCFSNFNKHMSPARILLKMQMVMQSVWSGAPDSAFPRSSQVMTNLLATEHIWMRGRGVRNFALVSLQLNTIERRRRPNNERDGRTWDQGCSRTQERAGPQKSRSASRGESVWNTGVKVA